MSTGYCVIITTCANPDDANKLITPLLDSKLAACIQVYSINSFYTWNGETKNDHEQILLIKAKASLYPAIEDTIRKNHTYEIPEIIQLPITTGSQAYLKWIEEVSR